MADTKDKKEETKVTEKLASEQERLNEAYKAEEKIKAKSTRTDAQTTRAKKALGKATEELASAKERQNKAYEKEIKESPKVIEATARMNRETKKLSDSITDHNLNLQKQAKSQFVLQKSLEILPKLITTISSGWKVYTASQYDVIKANNQIYRQFGAMPRSITEARVGVARMADAYSDLRKRALDLADSLTEKSQDISKIQEGIINSFHFNLRDYNEEMGKEIDGITQHLVLMQKTTGIAIEAQQEKMKEALESSGATLEDFSKGTEKVVNFSDDLVKSTGKLTEAQRHHKIFLRTEFIKTIQEVKSELDGVLTTQEDIAAHYAEAEKAAMKYGASAKSADQVAKAFTKNTMNQGRARMGLTPGGFLGGMKMQGFYSKMLKEKDGDKKVHEDIDKQLEKAGVTDKEERKKKVDYAVAMLKKGDFMALNEIMSATDRGKEFNNDFMKQITGKYKDSKFASIIGANVIPGGTGQEGPQTLEQANVMNDLYAGKTSKEAIKAREVMHAFDPTQKETAKHVTREANKGDLLDVTANNMAVKAFGDAAPQMIESGKQTAEGVTEIVKLLKEMGAAAAASKILGSVGGAATGAAASLATKGGVLGTIGRGASAVLGSAAAGTAGAALAAGGVIASGISAYGVNKGDKDINAQNKAKLDELDRYIADAKAGKLADKSADRVMSEYRSQLDEAKKNNSNWDMMGSYVTGDFDKAYKTRSNKLMNEESKAFEAKLADLKKAMEDAKTNPSGSHAAGNFVVPYANYSANLHKDEEVVSAKDRRSLSSKMSDMMAMMNNGPSQANVWSQMYDKANAKQRYVAKDAVRSAADPFSDMNNLPSQTAGDGNLRAQAKFTADNRFIITIAGFGGAVADAVSSNARSTKTGLLTMATSKARISRQVNAGSKLNSVLASGSKTLILRNKVSCEVMLTYTDMETKEPKFVTLAANSGPIDLYAYAPKLSWQKSESLRRAATSDLIEILDNNG